MSSECGPDGLPMLKQTAYTHAHTGSTTWTRWIYKRNMKLGGMQQEDRESLDTNMKFSTKSLKKPLLLPKCCDSPTFNV